jgi:hypothetical protein
MDVATGATVRAADRDGPAVDTAVWPSPDGRRVAAIVGDGLAVFDQASRVEVGGSRWGAADVVRWAPTRSTSSSRSRPRRDRRCSGSTSPRRNAIHGHTGFVTDARVDATGRWVVSGRGGHDGAGVRRGDGPDGTCSGGLPMRGPGWRWAARRPRAITSSKLFLCGCSRGRLEES